MIKVNFWLLVSILLFDSSFSLDFSTLQVAELSFFAEQVVLTDDESLLWVAGGVYGLHVYDVTKSNTWSVGSSTQFDSYLVAMFTYSSQLRIAFTQDFNLLFVANYNAGVTVHDVSSRLQWQSTNIVELSTFIVAYCQSNTLIAYSIALSPDNQKLYIASGSGLLVYNISGYTQWNTQQLTDIAQNTLLNYFNTSNAVVSLQLANSSQNYIVLACGSGCGLYIIDYECQVLAQVDSTIGNATFAQFSPDESYLWISTAAQLQGQDVSAVVWFDNGAYILVSCALLIDLRQRSTWNTTSIANSQYSQQLDTLEIGGWSCSQFGVLVDAVVNTPKNSRLYIATQNFGVQVLSLLQQDSFPIPLCAEGTYFSLLACWPCAPTCQTCLNSSQCTACVSSNITDQRTLANNCACPNNLYDQSYIDRSLTTCATTCPSGQAGIVHRHLAFHTYYQQRAVPNKLAERLYFVSENGTETLLDSTASGQSLTTALPLSDLLQIGCARSVQTIKSSGDYAWLYSCNLRYELSLAGVVQYNLMLGVQVLLDQSTQNSQLLQVTRDQTLCSNCSQQQYQTADVSYLNNDDSQRDNNTFQVGDNMTFAMSITDQSLKQLFYLQFVSAAVQTFGFTLSVTPYSINSTKLGLLTATIRAPFAVSSANISMIAQLSSDMPSYSNRRQRRLRTQQRHILQSDSSSNLFQAIIPIIIVQSQTQITASLDNFNNNQQNKIANSPYVLMIIALTAGASLLATSYYIYEVQCKRKVRKKNLRASKSVRNIQISQVSDANSDKIITIIDNSRTKHTKKLKRSKLKKKKAPRRQFSIIVVRTTKDQYLTE